MIACPPGATAAFTARAYRTRSSAATYLMLFIGFTDLGIAQNPMFGDGSPRDWATFLPGHGPGRMMVDAAFSPSFHAAGPLALALGWTVVLIVAVGLVLRRTVGSRS